MTSFRTTVPRPRDRTARMPPERRLSSRLSPHELGARRFDVCVVGSGASGSIVAKTLCEAGRSVVMIEQGRDVAARTRLYDLLPEFEKALARDRSGRWSNDGYPWSACVLGGGTRFYAGMSFRFRHVDFDASAFTVSETLDARWPFGYDELRESYDAVEEVLHLARSPGSDPLEPESAPPRLPPNPPSRRGRVLAEAGRKLGLVPFPTPLAVASEPVGAFPRCERLGACIGEACPSSAKWDPVSRILDPLRRRPSFTLATEVKALRFVASGSGGIRGLECLDIREGRRFRVRANTFVLAANAVQTAALLLRSASRAWPEGLGNSSGLVGRGLCMKTTENVVGWTKAAARSDEDDELERAYRGLYSTVAFSDFYLDEECPTGLGGLIFEANPNAPPVNDSPYVRSVIPRVPRRPGVLLRLEALLADQPLARNRVVLGNATSSLGVPLVVMDYRPHRADRLRLAHLVSRAEEILRAAGAHTVARQPSGYTLGSTHLHGTCRAGRDPASSVVAVDGRLHDVDDVYVVDGSYMPFPGGVNPTFTIQANALRIARGIVTATRPR
jgi:choline dehydrogenase-like flavoprotein